jgi:hypothetical protein
MKRVSLAAIAMMWACGGKAAPPPPTPTGNKPVDDKVAATDPKADDGPSCQLAARMLIKERGPGKIPTAHWDRARTAGEAEIVALCLTDQWDDETLKCFPKRASAFSCLSNLSSELQYKYERRIDDWEYFTMAKLDQGELGGAGYGGSDYGGMYGMGGMGGGGGGQPEEEWIACETSLGDVTMYAPAIADKVPDRDFLVAQRKQFIARTCNMQWKNPDKKCFGAAKDAAGIEACRGKLAPTAKNALANMITDSTAKHKKLVALKKKPKQIDCKAVSLSFYSDDSVRGKLTAIDTAERTRVLKESREKLSSVCTSEKWDATRRACTVLANGQMYDLGDCYPVDQPSAMYKWMFPVGGIFFKTGIMACDAATETIKKILACTTIEQSMRDSVGERYTQELSSYVEYGGMGEDVGKRCQELNDGYKAGAKEFGCPGF